jgi:hypothetical protein
MMKMKENRILLVVLEENRYPEEIVKLLKRIVDERKKIAYICLSKPYTDVIDDLKRNNIDSEKFFFIDVLSGNYKGKHNNSENCVFIDSPNKIDDLGNAIRNAIKEKGCDEIFIDTISSLLIYNEGFYVVKMVHDLKEKYLNSTKHAVLVSLSDDSNVAEAQKSLMKDLSMFADLVIEK